MTERAWDRVRRAFLPAAVAVLLLAGAVVPLPAFIQTPGSAVGVPACVVIAERPDAQVRGDYLFTTVAQREATVFELLGAVLIDRWRIVPRQRVLAGQPRGEYLADQRRIFLSSTERSIVVALEAAGLPVQRTGDGVVVTDVLDDTPAAGVLRSGDIITRVDGAPVRTTTELIEAIDGTAPLDLRVRRGARPVTATVRPVLEQIDDERRPVIGVRIMTHDPEVQLPLSVDVRSGSVGGPSAGLLVGLAVYDLVTDDDLAAGRRVAGTGTLGLDGRVGRIDNIGLKVAAAAHEGADVFLAPTGQADAARSAIPAGADLSVLAVETFDDARAQLAATADTAARIAPVPAQECRFATA